MEKRLEKIVEIIERNSDEIIKNIDFESIEVYNFLKEQFENSNIKQNYLFQFVYRSFYRLDNAGLTAEFKTEYFNLLEENRNQKTFDFEKILNRLSDFLNLKGQKTIQFSFATKMRNTIDNNRPIYDSKVVKMFGLSRPYQADFNKKLYEYLKQLELISNSYEKVIKEGLLQKTNAGFDNKFVSHNLTEMKKLDFIFWSAGKNKPLTMAMKAFNQHT